MQVRCRCFPSMINESVWWKCRRSINGWYCLLLATLMTHEGWSWVKLLEHMRFSLLIFLEEKRILLVFQDINRQNPSRKEWWVFWVPLRLLYGITPPLTLWLLMTISFPYLGTFQVIIKYFSHVYHPTVNFARVPTYEIFFGRESVKWEMFCQPRKNVVWGD